MWAIMFADDVDNDVMCDAQGGSLLAMTLMLILRHDHVTLYIGTCLFGLSLSSITPTALSVAEMYIELSGWCLYFRQRSAWGYGNVILCAILTAAMLEVYGVAAADWLFKPALAK